MDKIKQYFSTIYQSMPFFWILFSIFSFEIISFAGWNFPVMNWSVFVLILLVTFIFALQRLHYGIFIIFTELFIGSKGYLFSLPIGDFTLSIRIGLFLVVFLAYIIWIIREKKIIFFHWPLWKPYCALMLLVMYGVVTGWLRGNEFSTLFFDANGYIYIGLVLPLTQAIRSRKVFNQLIAVCIAASLALMIKTVLMLFLFSQLELFRYILPGIYRWIRESGVGEITRFPNGFSRIFFQSHIYIVLLFTFLSIWFVLHAPLRKNEWKNTTIIVTYILFAFSALVIFLSYSRSFWVSIITTGIILAVWLLITQKISFKRLMIASIVLVCTLAFDYLLALAIVNIPLPGSQGVGASALLAERTKDIGTEPAAQSRMELLKPLTQKTLEHPIFGSGLGTTVTYKSSDPRNLVNNPNGLYTTYAFEWGYLDLWLKFGAIGIGIYVYFFYSLYHMAKNSIYSHALNESPHRLLPVHNQNQTEIIAAIFSLITLLGIHFFTPYLNHPLGIGWILIVSLIITINVNVISSKDKSINASTAHALLNLS